ncbi:type II toxin-antitoxin system VapC family toxin [Mycobacterium riyadhense]|uniref:Ribonuclease VapC n=1 Tax=Mycobacterium riyadhense TaxID=486698 RepID=A0A1X2BQW0_9MYCO|nr:type II toxin-antitoxin system VapC family toxin [Mycobacterium riyadhense]MCV7148696.1 type II toxin-antitoxin system VapC family toxin [Mycobacterium riyadhense]ORW66023.1 twitching motility protein PilT [Mycobacterium riyadhense]VTO94704.1 tRNA(fMet)-specific endonuclease VapC [Mycobacterium riyadhense]
MILLDASILIGHFEPADSHHAQATAVLNAHLMDSFAASVITLAEVYAGAARSGQAHRLKELLEQLCIEELDLPAGAALRLGELRAATNLKMPDCCVLYTAEHHDAAIATFDDKLAARAGDIGIAVVDAGAL